MTEISSDELPTRWEIELEFVQSLSNIQYLNYLAQNNYLNNPEFLNYLEYLHYWKTPEYAKYIVYPNCLHILTLLQSEEFRKNIVNPEFMNTIMNDMVKRWLHNDNVNQPTPATKPVASANQGQPSEPKVSPAIKINGTSHKNGDSSFKLPELPKPISR